MIRVAVVGTNGFAQFLAHFIDTQTPHQFIILTRIPNPGLTAKGWQVFQADYQNPNDLRYKLAGIDTVISTISGNAQLALIDAAAAVHVRRFAASEFEGTPSARPASDVLDHERRAASLRLQHYEQFGMRYTTFTCGIFYERFAPGGMSAFQIGLHSDIADEGDYIMDIRRAKAHVPYYNTAGQPVYVCMTSARDVAQFVVAALDLPTWPRELRMRGDRMTVHQLVAIAEQLRGRPFERSSYTTESLQDELCYAQATGDKPRENRLQHLVATADGRYDFNNINLNSMVNVQPERFRDWLIRAWTP